MTQRHILKSTIIGLAVKHAHGPTRPRTIKPRSQRSCIDERQLKKILAAFGGRPNCHNCNGG